MTYKYTMNDTVKEQEKPVQDTDSEMKEFQTTLWESHIKISDPNSGEILLNQRD